MSKKTGSAITELLGNYFRLSLATKTFVFIGYSLRDEDLRELITLLSSEVGEFRPTFFVVTLEDEFESPANLDIQLINTDGAFFIHKLKEILVERGAIMDSAMIDDVYHCYATVMAHHQILSETVSATDHPYAIYSFYYQDGLKDALERVFARNSTGEYSNPERLSRVMESYSYLIHEANDNDDITNAAYIEGYLSAIEFMVNWPESEELLTYYLYPDRLYATVAELIEALEQSDQLDSDALQIAERIAGERGAEGIVFHHRPFL